MFKECSFLDEGLCLNHKIDSWPCIVMAHRSLCTTSRRTWLPHIYRTI
jgi:hypothetical protein